MKMKNKDEFFAVAHIQNEQGKNNLANFISLHSLKPLRKLFASWKWLEAASEKVQGANMSMVDLPRRYLCLWKPMIDMC